MKHFYAILIALLLCAPAQAQTLKSLMYNTTNRQIAVSTNLIFGSGLEVGGSGLGVNLIRGEGGFYIDFTSGGVADGTNQLFGFGGSWYVPVEFHENITLRGAITFSTNNTNGAATTRTNLGLGATNNVVFNRLVAGATNQPSNTSGNIVAQNGSGEEFHINAGGFTFYQSTNAVSYLLAEERLLGGGNWGVEASLTIRQSSATNGLLFVYRTNNEPFLGLANLIASNNTTISNETLFRVGVAEATNRSAQFGFRTVRTNNGGEGFATFSVFGYNALMMIGPSDRSRTNTATNAGIEADIWTITPTNRVMTLRDTNSGALTLHQDLGFGAGLTNTAPTNTNTPAVWMRVWVGTNNYRLPLYQ